MALVELGIEGGVATLTLNRPEKLNALNTAVFAALREHLETLRDEKPIRCVVLTGAGRSFCAGHDLGDLAAGDALDSRYFEAETIDLLEALPMPTIAKIRGHCLTGGLELALGCDVLIASDNARFGDTHGKWGLVPVWGLSVRLPERVGLSRAKSLMFSSRLLDGKAALELGLADHVASEAELDAACAALAREFCANSADSNRIVKTLLAANREKTRGEALRFERDMPFGLPEDSAERLAAAPGKKA